MGKDLDYAGQLDFEGNEPRRPKKTRLSAADREAMSQQRMPCVGGRPHAWSFVAEKKADTKAASGMGDVWINEYECPRCKRTIEVQPVPVSRAVLKAPAPKLAKRAEATYTDSGTTATTTGTPTTTETP